VTESGGGTRRCASARPQQQLVLADAALARDGRVALTRSSAGCGMDDPPARPPRGQSAPKCPGCATASRRAGRGGPPPADRVWVTPGYVLSALWGTRPGVLHPSDKDEQRGKASASGPGKAAVLLSDALEAGQGHRWRAYRPLCQRQRVRITELQMAANRRTALPGIELGEPVWRRRGTKVAASHHTKR